VHPARHAPPPQDPAFAAPIRRAPIAARDHARICRRRERRCGAPATEDPTRSCAPEYPHAERQ
jgi:hypothetical protein